LDNPLHVILNKSKLAYRIYVILIDNRELKNLKYDVSENGLCLVLRQMNKANPCVRNANFRNLSVGGAVVVPILQVSSFVMLLLLVKEI
jgi:hypothetical protein